jgi:hypothetical protein
MECLKLPGEFQCAKGENSSMQRGRIPVCRGGGLRVGGAAIRGHGQLLHRLTSVYGIFRHNQSLVTAPRGA